MSDVQTKRDRLRINEIFHSLQGEADSVGFRTVFVRLTGCPLRCQYCDTEYAFYEGDWRDIDAVLETVESFEAQHVCVTGGEPLAQPNCLTLLSRLCEQGIRCRSRRAVPWTSPRCDSTGLPSGGREDSGSGRVGAQSNREFRASYRSAIK